MVFGGVAYDLAPVKAPRLAGGALRLVARLLEMPLFSAQLEALAAAPARAGRVGAADYQRAYRDGKLGPEAVAEAVLTAIRDSNDYRIPPLRAIIACDEEDVRRQARASAERWQRGSPLSPLDGVPVAVKDELDQVPYPTTAGTRVFGDRPARADATAVARLRAAGALLVGKANMHEIGLGVTGMNPHTGFTRNPWDPGRVSGGSSSGSGAAVGAGLVPIALGADGGGSIRIPAGLCGVVGLKPTFGRVSEHGAFPICWTVAHVGPLAATALDCALAYAVCAGPDPLDPQSLAGPPVSLEGLTDGIAGLRLGIYRPWFEHADAEVVAGCDRMLAYLQTRGARLVEVDIPDLEPLRVAHALTIITEIASCLEPVYASGKQERLSAETRISIAVARTLTGRDFVQAQRVRSEAIGHFGAALERADVIVTPTTACLPPRIRKEALPSGESDLVTLTALMRFVVAANFTGLPAISFPAGYSSAGLPIGMQAIGRWWDEGLLLRLAHAAEGGVEPRTPTVHYQPLARALP
jgi:Asp-tRNA(Asn)/Glu-tRNA(Gln) amidotransferase A subunit family amidase